MNRGQLIATIAVKENISYIKAQKALAAILDHMSESLKNGDRVTFSGFGSFRRVRRQAQKGRNLRTGEEMAVPARQAIKFRPGKRLLEKVR